MGIQRCDKKVDSMEKGGDTISPLTAVLIVIASFVIFLFVGTAILVVGGTAFLLVFGELPLAIVPLGYMLHRRIDIGKYIGFKVKPKTVLLGIALGAVLFLFDLIATSTLVSIFGESGTLKQSNGLISDMSNSLQRLIPLIVSMGVAGVCEEFTFRGFLQNAIQSRYSTGIALLASALAFGLIHFDPQGLYTLSAFLLGLMLGYIYIHWHSYVVSAVAHSTLDLIALAMILLIR
jgi:membrane protease YdiL (CAAX protease family)